MVYDGMGFTENAVTTKGSLTMKRTLPIALVGLIAVSGIASAHAPHRAGKAAVTRHHAALALVRQHLTRYPAAPRQASFAPSGFGQTDADDATLRAMLGPSADIEHIAGNGGGL
jgi:hypothetical protein